MILHEMRATYVVRSSRHEYPFVIDCEQAFLWFTINAVG